MKLYATSEKEDFILAHSLNCIKEINGLIGCLKAWAAVAVFESHDMPNPGDIPKSQNKINANTKALKIAKYTFSSRLKSTLDVIKSIASLVGADFTEVMKSASNCVSLV